MHRSIRLAALAVALSLILPAIARPAWALEECRLLRQPDIQGDAIVFVYAGDLWRVPRAGGVATRLTSDDGVEQFPKLSPDGRSIAFTAEYDGNLDAYVMSADGGEPRRLTWHPSREQVAEWYPDGRSILMRSPRASQIGRFDRFFRISVDGGFEQMLPLPSGGYATLSPDARQIAWVSPSYDNRTWKHYRGGNAPEIWLHDFAANKSEKITDWEGPDEWPMWHGRTIYYSSDRDGRTVNVWAYDLDTKQHRRVTNFTEYDVKWPSIGSDAIVLENGGYLWVMSLPDEKLTKIQVLVPDDKPGTRAGYRNVSHWITNAELSPSAKRAVFEARGELFTVPAEKGDVRNLTQTTAARERDPSWSPDGKWIAYLSDKSGEYELHVIGSDGRTADRQVTKGGQTFRFGPHWSPDSKKLAFSDKTRTLWWCDVATGKLAHVTKSEYGEIHDINWSSDSRWLAFAEPGANDMSRIQIHSLADGKTTAISSGMTDDFSPAFGPEGKYLYFISRRTVNPDFGAFELNLHFSATDKIYAATLRDNLLSPVVPKSDEEGGASEDEGKKDDKSSDKKSADKKTTDKKTSDKKPAAAAPLRIDLTGIGGRIAEIPVEPGRLTGLRAFEDRLLYVSLDTPDPENEGPGTGTIRCYDLDERKDRVVIEDVSAEFSASKDGAKVLYKDSDKWGIVKTEDTAKSGDGKIATGELMANVDPRAEWLQMFDEAWRLERDFYYDPKMGGLDWKAVGVRYRQLVPYVAHRADLNYILGEMIGELGTSHAYVGGGDFPDVRKVDVGLLGVDWDLDARTGVYRFAKIYRDRDWNSKISAPLGEPGVNVREGDVLLAVNGRPVRAPENVYAAFVGTKGKVTRLTVGGSANDPKPRTVEVTPVASEGSLRYTAWVQANREKVDRATGGRVAYVHLPNTALAGIREFTKQYYPQIDKEGLIVDERWNGGGFIPDFFIERFARSTWVYWSTRDGADFRTPSTAITGPKCMIVNQYAGSGGDALPYYFRLAALGPVIGKRTWGGLVGISHDLPLVDGGYVTMPDFGMWDAKSGQWVVENHGVEPDIDIENLPQEMIAGRDPQLERAIRYCVEQLQSHPVKKPSRPTYKVQR